MSAAVPSHRARSHRRSRRRLLGGVLVGAVTMVGSAAMAMEVAVDEGGATMTGDTRTVSVTPTDRVDPADGAELPGALEEALAARGDLEPEPQPAPDTDPAPEPEPEADSGSEPAPESDPTPEPEPDTPATNPRTEVWDELARCESGQNWSIDTGNGYYGGLQFDHSSWHWAGGDRYSEYPHQATKAQQIEIAERLLDIHPAGWAAWPACSAQLGLS